jgi:hypothetical protein
LEIETISDKRGAKDH